MSKKSFEDPVVEFMYQQLIREAVSRAIFAINGGKVKFGGKVVRSLTMSKKLLETYPFDSNLIKGLMQTILESKKNLKEGIGPVSSWVIEEFDVIEKDGESVLTLKPQDGDNGPLRKVIACNETFQIIKEAHLKNNHAGFLELRKLLMIKYFFHMTCITSFLKLCTVCNKDPEKMKTDDSDKDTSSRVTAGAVSTPQYYAASTPPSTMTLLNQTLSASNVALPLLSIVPNIISSNCRAVDWCITPSPANLPKGRMISLLHKEVPIAPKVRTISLLNKEVPIAPKVRTISLLNKEVPIAPKVRTQRMAKLRKALNMPEVTNKKKPSISLHVKPNQKIPITRNMDKFKHCRVEVITINKSKDVRRSPYKIILVYMDMVSKYVLIRPLHNHPNVAEIVPELYKIFADFSTPELIDIHPNLKPLFDAILETMKMPPGNISFTVNSPPHISNIISEQVLLLVEKWQAIANCKDWLLGCLEIQKQLNSFTKKHANHLNWNPYQFLFGTKTAPYVNFNRHFDLTSVLEIEKNGGEDTNLTTTSSSRPKTPVIENIDVSSSASSEREEDDNDPVILIETEQEVIDLGDCDELDDLKQEECINDYPITLEEMILENEETETENNENVNWPLPIKTEKFPTEDQPESRDNRPSVPVGPFCFEDGPSKRVKLDCSCDTDCHECGQAIETPVNCESCFRPIHFSTECCVQLDKDDHEALYAVCKTCTKIESKITSMKQTNQCECQ